MRRDVLNYIKPISLMINMPKDNNKIAFHLELNCDWEVEHGLEWTICDGEILYVGSFENEEGWEEITYYKELNWNYVFNKTYYTLNNLPTTDIIKGFDHESELSPYGQEEFQAWKVIYEDGS